MEWIKSPWPWYVGGPLITFIMVLMLYYGKSFGISSTLRTVCTIGGASRFSEFFKIDWKEQVWNLFFVVGALIGGYIASHYMTAGQAIDLNSKTTASLMAAGILNPGGEYVPVSIFSWENLFTMQGFVFMVVGGFMVGFGTRYADGCTSGHAISGLSNLQFPSLIAVMGFFVGGLFVTHIILPILL